MEIPGLTLHPCKKQVCSCFLQVVHRSLESSVLLLQRQVTSYTMLPKRALPRALQAAKECPDRRSASHCPTRKKPGVGPQHAQDTSGLFTSLFSPASPGSASLSPSCHPQTRVEEPSSAHQLLTQGPANLRQGLVKVQDRKALASSSRVHSP